MRIKRQGLNPNETYCCTIRDIKRIFKDADIDIYFGYSLSRKEKDNRKYYQPCVKCSDMIIAKMIACKNVEDSRWRYNYVGSSIRFFIFDKKTYTEEMYSKFVQEVLPRLYELYNQHKEDNPFEKLGAFSIAIGFNGKNFNFYENKEYKWIDT